MFTLQRAIVYRNSNVVTDVERCLCCPRGSHRPGPAQRNFFGRREQEVVLNELHCAASNHFAVVTHNIIIAFFAGISRVTDTQTSSMYEFPSEYVHTEILVNKIVTLDRRYMILCLERRQLLADVSH